MTALFVPSSSAMVPQIVPSRDIVTANTLGNITWSTILMMGAAVGGVVTFVFGTDLNFIFDSLSYLLSAVFISLIKIKKTTKEDEEAQQSVLKSTENEGEELVDSPKEGQTTKKEEHKKSFREFWRMYKEGFSFLWQYKIFLGMCFMKASGTLVWSAAELHIIRYANQHFQIGSSPSLSMGLFYLSMGLGVVLGPLVVQPWIKVSDKNSSLLYLLGFVCLTTGCIGQAFANTFWLYFVVNSWRCLGSGLIWIHASSLLQRNLPNKLAGRVFSLEFAILTFASVISRITFGVMLDYSSLSPAIILMLYGLIGIVLLVFWIFFFWNAKIVDMREQQIFVGNEEEEGGE